MTTEKFYLLEIDKQEVKNNLLDAIILVIEVSELV